jgi:hypothetical protein
MSEPNERDEDYYNLEEPEIDYYEDDPVPTFQMLCDFIEALNDVCADGGRVRCNNQLCLILAENGSGRIGTWNDEFFSERFKFKTLGELGEYITDVYLWKGRGGSA